MGVASAYWQRKVCILCERIARTEQWLKVCREEIFTLHRDQGADTTGNEEIDEGWLVSIGFYENNVGCSWMLDIDGFSLELRRASDRPFVWCAYLEGDSFPVDLHVKKQVVQLVNFLKLTDSVPIIDSCKRGVHSWEIIEHASPSSGNTESNVRCVFCEAEDSIDALELEGLRERQEEL